MAHNTFCDFSLCFQDITETVLELSEPQTSSWRRLFRDMRSFQLCLFITSIALATFRQVSRYRRDWRGKKKLGFVVAVMKQTHKRVKRMLFIRTNTEMCFVQILFLRAFYVFGSCFRMLAFILVSDLFIFCWWFFSIFFTIFNKSLLRVSPLCSVKCIFAS